jgi:tRNA pseudouridine32 synthase / 23S rRNA pseudouridine746 synthase
VDIFLETEFLYVIDKPHGWLTTPARLMDDPRPCLGRELQSQVGRQIFPVHRLDFEVSGLTVWAKDPASHKIAQNWFEHSRVRKAYEAYSLKIALAGPQEWKSKLVRGKKRAFIADHGKPSVTLARTLGDEGRLTKWELIAVTGRPHQLRFEMANHGAPILGDLLYGGPDCGLPQWLALRAVELDLSELSEGDRLGLPKNLRGPDLVLPVDLALRPQ